MKTGSRFKPAVLAIIVFQALVLSGFVKFDETVELEPQGRTIASSRVSVDGLDVGAQVRTLKGDAFRGEIIGTIEDGRVAVRSSEKIDGRWVGDTRLFEREDVRVSRVSK